MGEVNASGSKLQVPISVWQPQMVVPLFVENNELLRLDLPLFDKSGPVSPESEAVVVKQPTTRQSQLLFKKVLGSALLDIEKASIVVAMIVSMNGDSTLLDICSHQNPSRRRDNAGELDFHHARLFHDAYRIVQDHPGSLIGSLDEWTRLVRQMMRDVHFAVEDHPLLEYADTVVPKLSSTELEQVRQRLQFKKTSALGIQKLLRDRVDEDSPRLYAVLLDPDESQQQELPLASSCLPTARLQLVRTNKESTVQLHSLFDGNSSSNTVSVALCPNTSDIDDAGFRDACMQQKFHRSCACLRCRYELFPFPATLEGSTVEDLLRLARHSLGSGNTAAAEILLQHIQQRSELDATIAAEVWHALGAIALQTGHFIKAQKIWKSAAKVDHPGLSLQRAKLTAYKYLDVESGTVESATPSLACKSPVPGSYVANVISPTVCTKLIRWAEVSNQWTRSRHYAVPTFDIPVHSLSGPFLSWFTDFMHSTMQPLLSGVFGTGRYFVHDAFCVRYDAAATSSYLPVRTCGCQHQETQSTNVPSLSAPVYHLDTDESTHSFVLALNQGAGRDYDGGGTYFFDADETVHLPTGSVLCFRGDDILHGGEPVLRGSRYIVAAFLYKGSASNDGCADVSRVFGAANSEPFSFGFLDA